MFAPTAPRLDYRGADYWYTDDPAALAALLRQRSDLHEWTRAAQDRKSDKELTRFYHKWPNYRGKVEPSGIVIERDGYVRLVGSDPARARRIVEQLAGGQAVEEVQLCLL
jgi:hypothetical protein